MMGTFSGARKTQRPLRTYDCQSVPIILIELHHKEMAGCRSRVRREVSGTYLELEVNRRLHSWKKLFQLLQELILVYVTSVILFNCVFDVAFDHGDGFGPREHATWQWRTL